MFNDYDDYNYDYDYYEFGYPCDTCPFADTCDGWEAQECDIKELNKIISES